MTYIGPGLNIALGCLDFQLGPFKVDKYSAPGVSHFRIVINLLDYILFDCTKSACIYAAIHDGHLDCHWISVLIMLLPSI